MRQISPLLLSVLASLCGMDCPAQTVSGSIGGHNYVDLGLPSRLKWATCNVGAQKPTDFGNYYAWGETQPKTSFHWGNYKWCLNGQLDEDGLPTDFTKYNSQPNSGMVDNKTALDASDDAATQNWGPEWHTPTLAEQEELLNYCTWKWVNSFNGSGVAGNVGTSKVNGHSIFFPATGLCDNDNCYGAGDEGLYWASTFHHTAFPQGIFIDDDAIGFFNLECYSGLSVRAVAK